MSDIKLFRRDGATVSELAGVPLSLERTMQTLFEQNLEALLGVRFLASEYATTHGGRMDTLGIDENGFPVIIEYKRDRSENVINQGLFYLDWLMDHRGELELLVRDKLDRASADAIEWSAPRLICIASDFNKYDEHAVKQMSRNIELIRYKQFGDDLVMLDLLTAVSTDALPIVSSVSQQKSRQKTFGDLLSGASDELRELYVDVQKHLFGLGDDVTKKQLLYYVAFKRIKNFACVDIKPSLGVIRIYLKDGIFGIGEEDKDFARDVTNVGHFGTGNIEVTIRTHEDLERAKLLIEDSYDAS